MNSGSNQTTIGLNNKAQEPLGLLKRSMDLSGMSQEHLQRRFFRLCLIAGCGAAAYGIIDIASATWSGPPNPEDPILMGICALVSFLVAFIVRKPDLDRSTMMDIAVAYQVLFCLIISLAEALNSRQAGDSVWGVSWVCVVLVAFPATLPYRRGPMLLAAVMSAFTGPIMYLIATPIQGKELILGEALNMYIPNFVTLGLASSTILFIANWAKTLEQARRMGSYRLVKRIGLGGMGEVWKAEHETLARPAAIKLIRASEPGSGTNVAKMEKRFYREAQATAALSSSHTVTVFDYGTTRDGDQYFVMELLDGITLQDAVSKYGPMQPERVICLLEQICQSLAEAHDANLIHRDIKPANIFICQKGSEYDFIKVLDFGLVKPELDSNTVLTLGADFLGTPAYIAPEVAKGNEFDQRSDIYSLGCVAYFLLSNELVFTGDNPIDMILKHADEKPIPIADRSSQPLPKGLNDLIMGCLAKDPSMRPQNCIEILDVLEKIGAENHWTRIAAQAWWQHNNLLQKPHVGTESQARKNA